MTDRIIDRVRKLLELSHSDNEHEAAQAGNAVNLGGGGKALKS